MNMQEIGLRIAKLRKERDMTQLELADKLGVSYQAVSSWERSMTMPDISKLPDISQVLAVSIDDLLGNDKQAEMVKMVLTRQVSDYDETIGLDELIEVAPILKPSQVNNLMAGVKQVKLSELAHLAPFITSEALCTLAMNAEEAGDISGLCTIAPFLEEEQIDMLAEKIENVGGIGSLTGIAPFMSEKALSRLAKKAAISGGLDGLQSIAPFLDKDVLSELVLAAYNPKAN